MKIVIQAPEDRMEDYLEEVHRQLVEGFTSGYWDAETQWEIES